jgi:hypothetical protein
MLPIQKTFSEKINGFSLTKTEVVKTLSSSDPSFCLKHLNNFLTCEDPDYDTAKKLASVLRIKKEEFDTLWHKTQDQIIRKKIRAKISQKKSLSDELRFA